MLENRLFLLVCWRSEGEKASKLKDRECIYAENFKDVTPNKPLSSGYNDPDKKGLSTGAIIGISVGALVIILSILFAIFR